jgi:hypothetical protein
VRCRPGHVRCRPGHVRCRPGHAGTPCCCTCPLPDTLLLQHRGASPPAAAAGTAADTALASSAQQPTRPLSTHTSVPTTCTRGIHTCTRGIQSPYLTQGPHASPHRPPSAWATASQAPGASKQGGTSSSCSRQQALLLHHKSQLGTSLVARREADFPEAPLRQAAGRSAGARAKPGVFYNRWATAVRGCSTTGGLLL